MIFFIDFLKAAAACLITNAHYTGIYPTDLIANGGLIGDILFFAVSGYCLYKVSCGFLKWYCRRLYRCYLSVIIMTVLYVLLDFYSLEEHNLFWWLVYPTTYHFVASIVVLYIPYYFVMKIPALRGRLPLLMIVIFAAAFMWYLVGYDRSYYHIDNVREPMIRVLFFESMLLGAWFRQNDTCIRGGGQMGRFGDCSSVSSLSDIKTPVFQISAIQRFSDGESGIDFYPAVFRVSSRVWGQGDTGKTA